MDIQILKRRRKGTPGVAVLRAKIRLVLEAVGAPPGAEISVLFTGDEEIAQLNRAWRGKEGPTDVLSFSQTEGEFGDVAPQMMGDMVISVDTAARQAEAAGRTLDEELDTLLAHGILHLAGYDHEKGPGEARRMFAKQRKIVKTLAGAVND